MKIRFLTLFISFFCFAAVSFAQNTDFEVMVLPQTNADFDENNKSISLVIKRKSDADFDTKQPLNIFMYLLKCPRAEKCSTIDDEYLAVGSVKGKRLAKTEMLPLRMNLAKFHWKATRSSIDVLGYRAPNFFEVPKENIYFYIKINVCKKPETKEKKPVCSEYASNEIVLNPER